MSERNLIGSNRPAKDESVKRTMTTKQEVQSRVAELRGALAQAEAELAAWPNIPTTALQADVKVAKRRRSENRK